MSSAYNNHQPITNVWQILLALYYFSKIYFRQPTQYLLNKIMKARSVRKHWKQLIFKLYNIIKHFHICLFSEHSHFRASMNIQFKREKGGRRNRGEKEKACLSFSLRGKISKEPWRSSIISNRPCQENGIAFLKQSRRLIPRGSKI